jgi:cardiolipin synthase
VIDGRVAFTGGTNLADEYVNEKRMHGYWKDAGIKIEGPAVDNFTVSYLSEWQFLTNNEIDYKSFLNKCQGVKSDGVVVPFVSGPNYPLSIAENMYANEISNAKEKLYIMTPYFIPDETLTNLLINKARSGVDVKIILPDVADKKFVYIVSRNNIEKLIKFGVKAYTMTHSFVHSKVILTENSAIVGSINVDLRSFNQQFESAVLTNETSTLEAIQKDFDYTISKSEEITGKNQKRRNPFFRIFAGLFNLISPFM